MEDSIIQLDDMVEAHIILNNPLAGAIIGDYLLNVDAITIRDRFWLPNFDFGTTIDRSPYPIKQAGDVFWTFFLKYCAPTQKQYLGWVRDILKHIACFERLLGIKAAGLQVGNILQLEEIMNDLMRAFGIKGSPWDADYYSTQLLDHPPNAYTLIFSLYSYDIPDKQIDMRKTESARALLSLLVRCNHENVVKLIRKIQSGKNTLKESPGFTKSDMYTKCHSTIFGREIIGGTPNPVLRYPEILTLQWDKFKREHTKLSRDKDGYGSLLELISKIPKRSPKVEIINEVLFYSRCMPKRMDILYPDVITISGRGDRAGAVKHPGTVIPHYYGKVEDSLISVHNYNVVQGIILSDPIPLKTMDVDAGDPAPVQEPKVPKPAKKKDEESTIVFWLLGLAAIGLYVGGAF